MENYVKHLFAAIAAASLVGCGGGSGSTPSVISGAVIDGYLKGAKVCLDINANLQCDTSEPQSTSADKGLYTLDVIAGTDTSKLHVLAVVDSTTIDADTGTAPVNGYTLLAPASAATVVTPLTTFVSHVQITNPGLTVEEAKAQSTINLNLPANTDFHKDYVASSDAGMHNVAKLAADVLGQAKVSVNTAALNSDSTADQKREAYRTALAQAQTQVANYSLTAKNADSDAALKSLRDAATAAVKSTVEGNATQLKADIEKQASQGSSSLTAVLAALKDGLFVAYSTYTYTDGPASGANNWVKKYGMYYWQLASTDGRTYNQSTYFTSKDQAIWTLNGSWPDSTSTSFEYAAKADGSSWVDNTTASAGAFTMNADGTVATATASTTGYTSKISFTESDVSGKKASSIDGLFDEFCDAVGTSQCVDLTFPTGSKIYKPTFFYNEDRYFLYGCDEDCGLGAWDSASSSMKMYTSLADMVKRTDGTTSHSSYLWIAGFPSVFSPIDDSTGGVSFRSNTYSSAANSGTGGYPTEIGKGIYTIKTIAGKKVMTFSVTSESTPGALHSDTSSFDSPRYASFVEHTNTKEKSYVQYGEFKPKGLSKDSSKQWLNRTAIDAFLVTQGYPKVK